MTWRGDVRFLYKQLILKDFRIRYRNMSLGVFWSLLNPLVMMAVLTFVFTVIYPARVAKFPVFVLCGIIPFNFFSQAWSNGTVSIAANVALIKRVSFPREVIPVSTVLSSVPHLFIQLLMLMGMAIIFGIHPGIQWLWLVVVWVLEILFVCGLAMIFSALNVFVQDTRYFVESASVVLFWLVPIFYDFRVIPSRYRDIYQFNPVAAIVLAMRNILLENQAPSPILLLKLALVSVLTVAVGHMIFQRLQKNFYQYL